MFAIRNREDILEQSCGFSFKVLRRSTSNPRDMSKASTCSRNMSKGRADFDVSSGCMDGGDRSCGEDLQHLDNPPPR